MTLARKPIVVMLLALFVGCHPARELTVSPPAPVRLAQPKLDPIDPPVSSLRLDQNPEGFSSLQQGRQSLTGADRDSPELEWSIGLDAIPVLVDSRPATDADPGSFSLFGGDGSYRLDVRGDLLAEVTVGSFRASTWSSNAAFATARRFVDNGGFNCGVRPPESDKASGPPRTGPPQPKVEAAAVRGFHLHGWTEESLRFVEYEGTFAGQSCRGTAASFREGDARAIWPGVLYAARTETSELGDSTIHLIGPAADWVAATGVSPDEETHPHVGSFTYLSVPLEKGRVSSLVMAFNDEDLSWFQALRTNGAPSASTRVDGAVVDSLRLVVDLESDGEGGGKIRIGARRLRPSRPATTLLDAERARTSRGAAISRDSAQKVLVK